MIVIKNSQEIRMMREAGRVVALALEELKNSVRPGISTQNLNEVAESAILKQGAIPAFKGLYGFPASLCVSVNCEVVHGIPKKDCILKEGDIVGLDLGALKDGFYGDAAITLPVGKVSAEAQKLMEVAQEALMQAIEGVRPLSTVGDIGVTIQGVVERAGFSVVREYVGHGIGRKPHEEPQIPNYGELGKGVKLRAGMVLAIEPMVNAGGWQTEVMPDKWTVLTKDRSLSAHFEHTVAVTPDGHEILTLV